MFPLRKTQFSKNFRRHAICAGVWLRPSPCALVLTHPRCLRTWEPRSPWPLPKGGGRCSVPPPPCLPLNSRSDPVTNAAVCPPTTASTAAAITPHHSVNDQPCCLHSQLSSPPPCPCTFPCYCQPTSSANTAVPFTCPALPPYLSPLPPSSDELA